MNTPIKKITLIMIFFMVLGQVAYTLTDSHAEEQSVEQFVMSWLLDSCDVGEEGQSEKILAEYGPAAEGLLIDALNIGPDEGLIREYQDSLQYRWKRRQEILGSTKGEVLSKQDAASMSKATKDDYLKRQLDSFKVRYQERAIKGMGIVGTDKSKSVLERYLQDNRSLLQDTAIEVFDAIKRRQ